MNKQQVIKSMMERNPHLSIVELAKRTGLSRTVFYKWKQGIFTNIQIKSVQAVADATDTIITIDGDNIEIIDELIEDKELDVTIEASYIIELQKNVIKNLKEKLNNVEKERDDLSLKNKDNQHGK